MNVLEKDSSSQISPLTLEGSIVCRLDCRKPVANEVWIQFQLIFMHQIQYHQTVLSISFPPYPVNCLRRSDREKGKVSLKRENICCFENECLSVCCEMSCAQIQSCHWKMLKAASWLYRKIPPLSKLKTNVWGVVLLPMNCIGRYSHIWMSTI